ncbi:MAG TPA: ABC transporter substrate-binding protein [Anaerolineales bacterium]|nr:ABC transporter substrate-binding protein [Anaerolineales bacterium]
MNMKRNLWLLLSLVLLASMLMASCAPQATATPVKSDNPAATQAPTQAPVETAAPVEAAPKILKVRLVRDINNLDTANVTGAVEDTITRTVMEGLFRYNADGKLEPQLAESYKVSPDGLTIDFTLRKGVQWQRGYGELTTDDVKYSYERFLVTDPKPAYADDWASLDHVEIVDKYIGKLVFKTPQATLWTSVLPMTSGLIVSKKYYEEAGPDKVKTDLVGTGPYLFSEWTPKQQIVLKRNPDYWGTQPYYDEIDLIPVDDDKAAEVALQAGELDFSGISLSSSDKFQSDPNFAVALIPSTAYNWIGMNVESPKLKDINVRQAVRYGIDVPSILAAAYNDKAPRANALIAEGTLGYWKDAPVYNRDVAKAKEYLAKANLKSLDLKLTYENTDEYSTWAQIVQQNLQEVGINVTLDPLDSSTFWSYGADGKDKALELFAVGYSSVAPEPAWSSMWFTCDQVDLWNWMRWCNKEFDALHKKGIETVDTAQREPLYIQMQQLWDADVTSIFVTNVPQVYVSKPNVKVVIYPGGLSPMLREFGAK